MKTGYDIILELVTCKDVLDIGSSGSQGEKEKPKILFNLIKERANSVVGIDIETDSSDIIKGNAETIKLKRKFDIITAGDVIEHIHNAGLFLDNMYYHLKKDGVIVIQTPNVKSPAYLPFRGNIYHTCWYCRHTLRYLLECHNFKIESIKVVIRNRENIIYDMLSYLFFNHLMFICRKVS